MNPRPLLLSALCLGLVAGCSKPITQDPMSDNSTTSTQTESPSGGTPSAEAGKGQPVAYIVKNSGIRCIAPPCPTHLAVPVNNPTADAIQIHEIDFEELGLTEEKREDAMRKADESPEGLKVEAVLETRVKAGPAGDATVLKVKKLLQ
ncbi:MAG: hypothetical protein JXB05_04780 [Myxococcaceae bacterium]|nr:hypothetical protein [Myxococcaceae bacterium]